MCAQFISFAQSKVNTDTELGCCARDNIHELITLFFRLVQPVMVGLMVLQPSYCGSHVLFVQIFVVVVRMMFLPLYEIVVLTCEGFCSSNTLSCCCRLACTETTASVRINKDY